MHLLGMKLAQMSARDLLQLIVGGLEAGQGGWLVTANLDILLRYRQDLKARAAYDAADVLVADGMSLVWASRLQGQPLPERIAGADLIVPLAEECEKRGFSMCLFGGRPTSAERAAKELQIRFPGLRIDGFSDFWFSSPPSVEEIEQARTTLTKGYDVVFVGLGSPKQEHLIKALRPLFPKSWMVGVGSSLSFISGDLHRAPVWLQRLGLEWTHRLLQEPKRLGRRYLAHDLPFFCYLIAHATANRYRTLRG